MARFGAAKSLLDRLFQVDPVNPGGRSLAEKIENQLGAIRLESNHTENSRGNNRRNVVLIVDQDERILVRLSDRLRRYGFIPVSAIAYDEAVDLVETASPDLVISEVNFADGPSGVELFHWLRSREQTRKTPFLFLATRIDRELLIAGKRLGVDDFLFKPADEEVVAASVSNCLARSKAR
jgi:PleD family two-component response regulator